MRKLPRTTNWKLVWAMKSLLRYLTRQTGITISAVTLLYIISSSCIWYHFAYVINFNITKAGNEIKIALSFHDKNFQLRNGALWKPLPLYAANDCKCNLCQNGLYVLSAFVMWKVLVTRILPSLEGYKT